MNVDEFSPWPFFANDEVDAVSDVLRSRKVNYWTGDICRRFEVEFANFSNTKHAIALANGTVALDLAFKCLGIGPGDDVIVTSRTFLATVSSIINAGAKPIFADVDPGSQNVTLESIKKALTVQTKCIVCVHLAGWPCDMDPIMEFAVGNSILVVEDCAQAHGAIYKGRPVGSIGNVGCWSFCQDKIMSTGGEGGMVTTNDSDLWSAMWSYKDHGKNWEAVFERVHPEGFRWLHESFGTNWRMTEMQAAIGLAQLKKMPEWNQKRLKNARRIWTAASSCHTLRVPQFFCDSCIDQPKCSLRCVHAAYKCYVFVKGGQTLRDNYLEKIREKGVPCFSGSCSEVYLEKAFDDTGLRPAERLKFAKILGEESLMFLCHPTLTEKEINFTCDVIQEVCC